MQYKNGQLHNGFDYDLQVYVVNGVVQQCGHVIKTDEHGFNCCNASKYAGSKITDIRSTLNV